MTRNEFCTLVVYNHLHSQAASANVGSMMYLPWHEFLHSHGKECVNRAEMFWNSKHLVCYEKRKENRIGTDFDSASMTDIVSHYLYHWHGLTSLKVYDTEAQRAVCWVTEPFLAMHTLIYEIAASELPGWAKMDADRLRHNFRCLALVQPVMADPMWEMWEFPEGWGK